MSPRALFLPSRTSRIDRQNQKWATSRKGPFSGIAGDQQAPFRVLFPTRGRRGTGHRSNRPHPPPGAPRHELRRPRQTRSVGLVMSSFTPGSLSSRGVAQRLRDGLDHQIGGRSRALGGSPIERRRDLRARWRVWPPLGRGGTRVITGSPGAHGRAPCSRYALEAIAHQVAISASAMADPGPARAACARWRCGGQHLLVEPGPACPIWSSSARPSSKSIGARRLLAPAGCRILRRPQAAGMSGATSVFGRTRWKRQPATQMRIV